MRETVVGIALALLCCARAQAAPAPEAGDALPPGLAAYASAQVAVGAAAFVHDEHAHYWQTEPALAQASETQSYWPVLYSLLLPGLGELTMGYTFRGIALMAVDIGAWTGYVVNHEDGLDQRDAYEAFADQYWTERKFIDDHYYVYPQQNQTLEYLEEQGQAASGSGGEWWTGYIPYVSKAEDKQHYYENLGKYDWFVSGWSDYDPTLDPLLPASDLREEYRAMRNESNESLDDANSFLWLNLATRVFSIAETAIIIHNRREAGGQASRGDETSVSMRARPRGWRGGELALEVRF